MGRDVETKSSGISAGANLKTSISFIHILALQ